MVSPQVVGLLLYSHSTPRRAQHCWHLSLTLFINSVERLVHTRYNKIPPVSRFYLTGAFLTTAACAVDIISPLTLYFNYDLIVHQGQLWRLITPYLFFGVFSMDFLFHMYFLVRSKKQRHVDGQALSRLC
jgi:Der1-like family